MTVGAVASMFPIAKSLKAVNPLPVAVVAVLVDPPGGAVQVPPANFLTPSAPAAVLVPASRSPAAKVNAAL